MNLAVWVERHARRLPDAPALADGERLHASWAEFAARAAGAAAACAMSSACRQGTGSRS